ncbi:MAG TPA: hypothetical protein DEV93_10750 [Chloroflexi bacterium]|jgi:hypothetical protein|nr:hypothetical protein [Chloroflexota bacterium]
MAHETPWSGPETPPAGGRPGGGLGVAVLLAALAAIGAGLAIQQIIQRRLSKPEIARLKFYRYLRERGHLES